MKYSYIIQFIGISLDIIGLLYTAKEYFLVEGKSFIEIILLLYSSLKRRSRLVTGIARIINIHEEIRSEDEKIQKHLNFLRGIALIAIGFLMQACSTFISMFGY